MKEIIFNDVTLSVIDRNGEQWLTASDLSKALYPYKRVGQNDAPFTNRVMKNYNRNKDEFTDKMTSLIDVQTAGGVQKMRVFSLRGAHLVAIFTRSERAKEFRAWVLDLIDSHKQELSALQTEYHQAIVAYEIGRLTASIHGKGLNQWKHRKHRAMERVNRIAQQIQPDLLAAL